MEKLYYIFPLLILLIFSAGPSYASANTGTADTPTKVICNVVSFVQKLGLPIMTGVILGAAIMAIFGKLAWAAIVMLVVFTAIFFGASTLIQKFAAGVDSDIVSAGEEKNFKCIGGGKAEHSSSL